MWIKNAYRIVLRHAMQHSLSIRFVVDDLIEESKKDVKGDLQPPTTKPY